MQYAGCTVFYSALAQFIVAVLKNLRRPLARPQDAPVAFAVRHAVSSERLSRANHFKPLPAANHGTVPGGERSLARPLSPTVNVHDRGQCRSPLSLSLPTDITRVDKCERVVTALPRTGRRLGLATPASCPSARTSTSSRRLLLEARSHSAVYAPDPPRPGAEAANFRQPQSFRR